MPRRGFRRTGGRRAVVRAAVFFGGGFFGATFFGAGFGFAVRAGALAGLAAGRLPPDPKNE
jgi:hypothetical protein